MTTINGQLWPLLLLALVPILIHLLIRQRLPRVRWAAMTFLLRAMQKNRRKLLLETILLLAVRTLIVLVMAAVILRPVSRRAWGWLASQRQPAVSVVVLDDSASMAASDGITTRLQRAILRVNQYLDELPGGSEVAVVLAGRTPSILIRQPTRDVAFVRESLARLTARDGTAAIGEALDRARSILAQQDSPNRQVFIVTDGQTTNWQRDRTRTALSELASNTAVLLAAVPSTPAANIAVADVSIAGGPGALVPHLATTLWPTSVSVKLTPFHQTTPMTTSVELFVDGLKVARRQVTVSPDRPSMVSLEYRFNSTGPHAIAAQCESDLFERDNQRFISVDVCERIGVLAIDGHPAAEPFASATGFLCVGLWPVTPDDAQSTALFDVEAVTAANLDSVQPGKYPLIVLADIAALPTNVLQQIKSAVREGAGLLVVAGPQVSGSGLAAMLADENAGPLPVQFGPPIDLPEEAGGVGLRLVTPVVPALAGFEDPALMEALSRVNWRTARPIAETRGAGVQTWANFTKGGAALVVNTYGKGRVAYFGGSADRRGSDFPLSPAFVPFVQQLAFYLLGGGREPAVQAGQPLEFPAGGFVAGAQPSGTKATLVYPDGTTEPADAFAVEDALSGWRQIVLPSAQRAGIYALRVAGDGDAGASQQGNKQTQHLRAANVPADESDLAVVDPRQMSHDLEGTMVRLVAPDQTIQEALRSARGRAELSSVGLLLLIVLLGAEMLLVKLFTPRQIDTKAFLQRAMRI